MGFYARWRSPRLVSPMRAAAGGGAGSRATRHRATIVGSCLLRGPTSTQALCRFYQVQWSSSACLGKSDLHSLPLHQIQPQD